MGEYTNEKTLLRIYMYENDRYGERPLSEALMELFDRERLVGATVLRGIAGFCVNPDHSKRKSLERPGQIPLIVELISCRARIAWLMPKIEGMMGRGMITMGTAKVVRYRVNNGRAQMLADMKKATKEPVTFYVEKESEYFH